MKINVKFAELINQRHIPNVAANEFLMDFRMV